jgi:hypothetical protein
MVWLIFSIGQFVSGTVSCKVKRICLFLLPLIELELYPSGDNVCRRLHPFINDSFFYQVRGLLVATVRPERVAYARAGETLARVPRTALGKISLARSIHCCPSIFHSFARPLSPYCEHYVYTHISDCVQTVYELPLLPNNTAVKLFTQIGAVRIVDWIFIVGAPVWRWPDQYVTLGRTFYSLIL